MSGNKASPSVQPSEGSRTRDTSAASDWTSSALELSAIAHSHQPRSTAGGGRVLGKDTHTAPESCAFGARLMRLLLSLRQNNRTHARTAFCLARPHPFQRFWQKCFMFVTVRGAVRSHGAAVQHPEFL